MMKLRFAPVGQAGVLVGWGFNQNQGVVRSAPQAAQVPGAVQAVASGGSHVLLLLTNGSVIAYGDNYSGQLDIPASVQSGPVTAIAAGGDTSMALLLDGTVECWGDNSYSQCNITNRTYINIDCDVLGGNTYTQLKNGSWAVWGYGADLWAQTSFSSCSDIIQLLMIYLSIGPVHYIVLLQDGTVLRSTSAQQPVTVLLPARAGTKSVCAASDQVLALLANDTVIPLEGSPPIPSNVQGRAVSLACAPFYAVVNLTDGSPVGIDTTIFDVTQTTPSLASTGSYIKAISPGLGHVAYLMSNGVVLQAGTLYPSIPLVPDAVSGPVTAISAGVGTFVAIQANGNVAAWGSATAYPDLYNIPDFSRYGTIKAVAAGKGFALALTQAGSVVQWGGSSSIYGAMKTSVPTDALFGISAVCASAGYALAVKQGKVIGWSDEDIQICNISSSIPPAAMASVTKVSCAYEHALALLQNGSVVAWGCNNYGQLDVPSSVANNVQAVSAGGGFSMALLNSGRVIVWGGSNSSISAVPFDAQQDVIQISAGFSHCLALLANKSVIAWDDGSSGSNVTMFPDEYQGRVLAIAAGLYNSFAIVAPPPSPATTTPITTPSQPPQPTSLNSSGSNSNKPFPTAAVAGSIAGGGAALLLLLGITARIRNVRNRNTASLHGKHGSGGTHMADADGIIRLCVDAEGGLAGAMDIPGVTKGDVFTRSTAHAYSWVRGGTKASELGSIEAGLNDYQLDRSAVNGIVPPAIELSMQQVREQVSLLQDGLLGRGATALVFRCLWPSRFGKHYALAIKVLKDGYDSNQVHLQSFSYEASVLASLHPPHPNVVRLYGYCLEPPTVCLILELLPTSLKSILANEPGAQHISSPLQFESVPGKQLALPLLQKTETAYVTSSSDTATSTVSTVVSTYGKASAQPHMATAANAPFPGSTSADNSVISTVSEGAGNNVRASKQLNMLQVCKISLDIAAALKYLHSNPIAAQAAAVEAANVVNVQEEVTYPQDEGATPATSKTSQIVHRDLKPANILMNSKGTAKISDFGLARPHDRDTLMTDHIGAGTLPYMPPELLMGARVKVAAAVGATNRVDIYSTAMIMWELLAGRAPWSNMSGDMIHAAVLNGRRPELPSDNKDAHNDQGSSDGSMSLANIPASLSALPEFNAIIRACWQQRDHRRPSAATLHEMLNKLMEKYGNSQHA